MGGMEAEGAMMYGAEPGVPGEDETGAAAAAATAAGEQAAAGGFEAEAANNAMSVDEQWPPLGGYGGPGGYNPGWGGNYGYQGYNNFQNQGKKKNKNKNKGDAAAKQADKTGAAAAAAPAAPATPAAKTVEQAAPLSSENWPPALKAYVSRCFDQCKSDMDKDQVEIILKGKITAAASSKTLWTKNWEEEPLPSTLSSKLSVNLADMSSRGKVFRGGRGGRGQLITRSGRPDLFSGKKKGSSDDRNSERGSSKNGSKKADYGDNPNMVPLGGGGSSSKGKNKKGKVPYFYTNPLSMPDLPSDIGSSAQKQKRAARFAGDSPPPTRRKTVNLASLNDRLMQSKDCSWEDRDGIDWAKMHIVGTCQKLEKPYLRLTEAPEAHKVRPVSVLRKSLKMVKEHWVGKSDYRYACDQLKSIRQDLTVQGVRDSFTVQV